MFAAASADTTLQGYLLGANNTLRWFPVQLEKGYIYQGSCVVTRQISSVLPYVQSGPLAMEGVMMQIECHDLDSLVAQALANYLVSVWFPSTPFNFAQAANIKLSQHSSLNFQVQPKPAWVEILTYRIQNDINA